MSKAGLEQLWQDARYWWKGTMYHCAQDPRIIVPQRHRIGWTWNFGHPWVWPVLLVSIAAVAGPAWWYTQTHGCPSFTLVAGYVGMVIVVGIVVGAFYSRRFIGR